MVTQRLECDSSLTPAKESEIGLDIDACFTAETWQVTVSGLGDVQVQQPLKAFLTVNNIPTTGQSLGYGWHVTTKYGVWV